MQLFSMLLATQSIQEAKAIELTAGIATSNSAMAARLSVGRARRGRGVRQGLRCAGADACGPARVRADPADRRDHRAGDQARRLRGRPAGGEGDGLGGERPKPAVVPLATYFVIGVVAVILIGLYGDDRALQGAAQVGSGARARSNFTPLSEG